MSIHSTAVVSKGAEVAADAVIGPYCIVQGNVKIGSKTVLDSHVVVGSEFGRVTIGERNRFFPYSSIGGPPQDLGYKGDPTEVIIGNDNTFREMITVNKGTIKGGSITRIGDANLIMAYVHIGHDCQIGNQTVLANSLQLGGHVIIEDHAKTGGVVAVNQFVRIGRHAFVTGASAVNKDVLPYTIAQGNHAIMRACNRIGMERAGIGKEEIESVVRAVRFLTQGKMTVEESLKRIQAECEATPALHHFVDAIAKSERGLAI